LPTNKKGIHICEFLLPLVDPPGVQLYPFNRIDCQLNMFSSLWQLTVLFTSRNLPFVKHKNTINILYLQLDTPGFGFRQICFIIRSDFDSEQAYAFSNYDLFLRHM